VLAANRRILGGLRTFTNGDVSQTKSEFMRVLLAVYAVLLVGAHDVILVKILTTTMCELIIKTLRRLLALAGSIAARQE